VSSTAQKPPRARSDAQPTVSVVIPCLNEEENITACVDAARLALEVAGLSGEVIVVDNASEDHSAELARAAGALVVSEPRRGYGSAYLAGFAAARGTYIAMADADLTYDFNDIPRFVGKLDGGADLVMGDRMDNIQPGAMPWLHQYIGNPLLSGFLNLLFRTGVRDAHCGMRAFRRDVLPELDLRTTGMEFASEMVIRAAKAKLQIDQISIEYHPRGGESKLDSFRDGWRHLRFLLVHHPTALFVIPGMLLFLVGVVLSALVLGTVTISGYTFQLHSLIAGSLLVIVGVQLVGLGLAAHTYATYFMSYSDDWFDRARAHLSLEHGLLLGTAIVVAGIVFGVIVLIGWVNNGLGSLSHTDMTLTASTLVVVGVQIFFTSFLLSILGLRRGSTAATTASRA
jgi:glycosyltransferase involved in cell wall biosynthesis